MSYGNTWFWAWHESSCQKRITMTDVLTKQSLKHVILGERKGNTNVGVKINCLSGFFFFFFLKQLTIKSSCYTCGSSRTVFNFELGPFIHMQHNVRGRQIRDYLLKSFPKWGFIKTQLTVQQCRREKWSALVLLCFKCNSLEQFNIVICPHIYRGCSLTWIICCKKESILT